MKMEYRSWPKATPQAALATRSPDGRFITRSRKHGGDGLSSHSETHDCIFVADRSCPEYSVEFASQDHAHCEDAWWLCRPGDGVLLHEQFAVELRWLDSSRLELSWTELTGLDADGHRRWGTRSQVYALRTVKDRPRLAPGGDACTEWLDIEPVSSP